LDHSYYDKTGHIIDFYIIFNISNKADPNEIKSAFRNLIKRYHPDTADKNGTNTDKIDLIIRGYRILIDEDSRLKYDEILTESKNKGESKVFIIPKKRIIYSVSLKNMLKAKLQPRGIKRKDILYNFGQDIEILVNNLESKIGATAYIDLPAKMYCPLCMGSDLHCYVCRGIGRISTTSLLEVKIPPGIKNNTLLDVDLMKVRPDKSTEYNAKSLRIKIVIIDEKKLSST